jgi:ferredoxin
MKYTLLGAVVISALFTVGLAGYVAAIPVFTRSMMMIGEPLQTGLLRGWHQVPPVQAAQVVSLALFAGILLAGVMQPRFWCRYMCPSGALFSLASLLRLTERKVDSSCRACGQCVEACPFDAIDPDNYATRGMDCTLCQTCGGACPFGSIHFYPRWERVEQPGADATVAVAADAGPTGRIGRRRFLSVAAAGACAVGGGIGLAGVTRMLGDGPTPYGPVRPPGSLPEESFLERCVRCGLCLKACPNHALQADLPVEGPERLWTPVLAADWAGCEPSCNACGQVCPTGAIRALPLEEKREERMGLARVDEQTCLPYAGRQECRLCVDECQAAGYHAIEFRRVGTRLNADGFPIEGSGYLAPVVLADRCVGCGLCQTRCYHDNVRRHGLLEDAAIRVGR